MPSRTRSRASRAARHQDGPLQLALRNLADAVHDLTAPQPHTTHQGLYFTAGRYTQLREALYDNHGGNGHNQSHAVIPMWLDALKLAIHIDTRTRALTPSTPQHMSTPGRLHHSISCKWRPQDTPRLTTMTEEISSFCIAIDDLFAQKPIYLRGETCPLCGQDTARIKTDDGEVVNRPALAITSDGIAICQSCHDTFPSLEHLGRLLRFQAEGLPA
jgi:hypothetical protein